MFIFIERRCMVKPEGIADLLLAGEISGRWVGVNVQAHGRAAGEQSQWPVIIYWVILYYIYWVIPIMMVVHNFYALIICELA